MAVCINREDWRRQQLLRLRIWPHWVAGVASTDPARVWWNRRLRCRAPGAVWEVSGRRARWSRLRRSCRDKVYEPAWGWVRERSLPAASWLRRLLLNIKAEPEWFQDREPRWCLHHLPCKAREYGADLAGLDRPTGSHLRSFRLHQPWRVAAVFWPR